MTDLGACVGSWSVAGCINDSGAVVGYGSYAWLWQNGAMTDLGTLEGSSCSEPSEINNIGQVVGSSYISTADDYHAFLWDNGTMTDLGTLPGCTGSWAYSINDSGQVVGHSYTPSGYGQHGFIWQNGSMTDLGTLPGADASAASDINNAGQIVGGSSTLGGNSHACLWQKGTVIDLGTLGGSRSDASAINNRGQIAGWADASDGSSHACLWNPVSGLTNKAAFDPIISAASAWHAFKVWGKVTVLGSSSFTVDDGSGMPVTVIAPGFTGIADNDYASATGMFSGERASRVLNAQASGVVKLH